MATIPCFGGKRRFGPSMQHAPSPLIPEGYSGTKKLQRIIARSGKTRSNPALGNLPTHGEPTMRKKAAPGEIAMLALRLLVVPPLLLHVALLRLFLNWTWNGGFP